MTQKIEKYYYIAHICAMVDSKKVDRHPELIQDGYAFNYGHNEDIWSELFSTLEDAQNELAKYHSTIEEYHSQYAIDEYCIYEVRYDTDTLAKELEENGEPVDTSNLLDWEAYIDDEIIETTHFNFTVWLWNKEQGYEKRVKCTDYADAVDVEKKWDDLLYEHDVCDYSLKIEQNTPYDCDMDSEQWRAVYTLNQ